MAIFSLIILVRLSAEEVQEHTVQIKMSTFPESNPYRIKINWVVDTSATSFDIYRMEKGGKKWINIGIFNKNVSEFVDSNVFIKKSYEYKIVKNTNDDFSGFNYAAAGDSIEYNYHKGLTLILIDDSLKSYLDSSVTKFRQILYDDGWTSVVYTVPRSDSFNIKKVKATKAIIDKVQKDKGTDLKTAIFIGRVAVPYSGNYAIDGHLPDHYGAWAADVYYSVFSKAWTDTLIKNKGASREINWNVPVDGKWDQTVIPDSAKLAIGRIDFYNQNVLEKSEVQLINEYIQKDENYRRFIFKPLYRGLISDKFHVYDGEAFASCAWMSFSAMFGYDKVDTGEFVPSLQANPYIWSYACGSSSFHHVGGNLLLEDCRDKQLNGVFAPLFGSYFADWDFDDVIMRVFIGSQPSVLVSFFNGRPYWFFHNMSLGETFAYSQLLSINNRSLYESASMDGFQQIHLAVLGDPTLRMYYYEPPQNVKISQMTNNTNEVSWDYENSGDIIGFNVYRSNDFSATPDKLNSDPLNSKYFTDNSPITGRAIYTVKALRLEKTASGSFFNESVGSSVIINKAQDVADNNDSLRMYPNPVKDLLTVEGNFNTIEKNISIYNSIGEKVAPELFKVEIFDSQLQITFNNALERGLYILYIKSKLSNKLLISKVFLKI